MRYSRWLPAVPLLLACALLVPWAGQGIAEAESSSSCVTCHLDEDMLVANLAEVKTKASAKQAGAG
jgi:hypothetical protein